MIDARRDTPSVHHALAVALRFEDIFTGEPVRAPLVVSIPSLRWTAIRADDDSYRFVTSIEAPPPGVHAVDVVAPGGEYRNFVPFDVTLPHAAAVPPTRLGWMITRPLWPTRGLRFAPGETGLVGRLETAGVPQAGRKIRFTGGPAPEPFTFSDQDGEFIARFPHEKRDILAPIPVLHLTRTIEIDDGAATATPDTVTIELATVPFQRFEVT